MTQLQFKMILMTAMILGATYAGRSASAQAADTAAQAQAQRTLNATQYLAQQRTAAMDQLALCSGDLDAVRAELAAAKAEIEKMKTPPAPAKKD